MSLIPRQRVVVPYDFSDESLAAIDVALDTVESPEHVSVLHVLEEISPAEPGEIWDAVDHDSRRQHAMQRLRADLADSKYKDIQIDVQFGDPGHTIADFAAEQKADLIVMPSHGRTGLKRILIGSVAERVVRLAHCPVLVLRS
jgi:nucleotide-binding universal stress UspA family protein